MTARLRAVWPRRSGEDRAIRQRASRNGQGAGVGGGQRRYVPSTRLAERRCGRLTAHGGQIRAAREPEQRQGSRPDATTALFWLLAVVSVAVLGRRRCRERLTIYELCVLTLTFVGAVQAVRGVIWFALAAAAILPVALDGVLTRADIDEPRVNRMISLAALGALAVALVVFIARPASWFVSEWPEGQVEAVRAATRDPAARVWATDGTADWLLWRIPDLRGRIAFDVRFELYGEETLGRLVAYGRRDEGWQRLVDGYDVLVVDDPAHLRGLAREPETRVAYRDKTVVVLERTG